MRLFAWVAWRFGPTLLRFCGIASWWAGWACGSQGGYGYMAFLLILGTARLERRGPFGTTRGAATGPHDSPSASSAAAPTGQTPDAERNSSRYPAR